MVEGSPASPAHRSPSRDPFDDAAVQSPQRLNAFQQLYVNHLISEFPLCQLPQIATALGHADWDLGKARSALILLAATEMSLTSQSDTASDNAVEIVMQELESVRAQQGQQATDLDEVSIRPPTHVCACV